MELVKNWAMTLAGIVVFGSVCEVILPDGVFRKYIRLSIGLILVLTLVSPLQKLIQSGTDYELPEVSKEAYMQRSDMEQSQQEEVLRLYRTNLNAKMKSAIRLRIGELPFEIQCRIEENNPETFGTILSVMVLTAEEPDPDITAKIKEILYEDFGVSKDKVMVGRINKS